MTDPLAILTLASSSQPAKLVLDMLVILGAAAVISILLRRLHLASIPGYLIMGAILGSLPFGIISDAGNVAQIQDIAIILLMFTIGLHLDLDSIRTGMVPILIVGAVSTVAVTLALWPAGMAFGLSAPAALAIAMAFSMSSTAVILGILHRHREIHLLQGRLGVGISIMQDLLSIGILAAMPLLGAWHGAGPAAEGEVDQVAGITRIVANASLGVGGILAMLGFARYLLPKLLKEAAWGGNTEGLLVASAGAGLAAAMLSGWLGFGPALGAFLAGFMLSNTPFRFQLTGQLGPMRDLFMAVFFTAVGINLNVVEALQYWWVILIAVPLVIIVKAGVIGATIWAGGSTAAAALVAGTLLAQAGEFSLVVLSEAQRAGLVGEREQGVAIALVVVSLMLTGTLYDYAKLNTARVAFIKPVRWFASPALRGSPSPMPQPVESHAEGHEAPAVASASASTPGDHGSATEDPAPSATPPPPKPRHVIIAGFGIVGRNLAEHFAAAGISYTLIDLNSDTVARQHRLGKHAVFGDATNKDVLESAGIRRAEAIVLTIPDDDASLRACRSIREIRDDIFIAVRTSFLSRAIAAHELGADHVTIEEVATAQDMASKVMLELNKRFAPKADAIPHL